MRRIIIRTLAIGAGGVAVIGAVLAGLGIAGRRRGALTDDRLQLETPPPLGWSTRAGSELASSAAAEPIGPDEMPSIEADYGPVTDAGRIGAPARPRRSRSTGAPASRPAPKPSTAKPSTAKSATVKSTTAKPTKTASTAKTASAAKTPAKPVPARPAATKPATATRTASTPTATPARRPKPKPTT